MLHCYIACGEVFDNAIDAGKAEETAFKVWWENDEMACKIIAASGPIGRENAIGVLYEYWGEFVNNEVSIDCVKLIDSEPSKDCTVIVGRDDPRGGGYVVRL